MEFGEKNFFEKFLKMFTKIILSTILLLGSQKFRKEKKQLQESIHRLHSIGI